MKTKPHNGSVSDFLAAIDQPRRKADATIVATMMEEITGVGPIMWGSSIVGFGTYQYCRSDGSEHEFMLTALSPRKASLTVYIVPGFANYQDLMDRLGKHKHTVSCLYITNLDNIDLDVLRELISRSVDEMRQRYPS
jgi:hypothetical protein